MNEVGDELVECSIFTKRCILLHQPCPAYHTPLLEEDMMMEWNFSDFNLSGCCFGTEIIQNCTKWLNIGVHGLRLGPIEAEFQGASFLIEKNAEK